MPDGVVFYRINITVGNGQRGIAALEGIEKGAFVEIAHIEIFRRVRIVQAVAVNGERDHRFAFGQSAGKRGIVCLAQDFSALRIVQNAVVLRDGGLDVIPPTTDSAAEESRLSGWFWRSAISTRTRW